MPFLASTRIDIVLTHFLNKLAQPVTGQTSAKNGLLPEKIVKMLRLEPLFWDSEACTSFTRAGGESFVPYPI